MRYFTSDWHLGHERILTLCARPFTSVDSMNQAIIDSTNAAVGKDDELWIVGDLALGSIHDSLAWLSKLTCRNITLIAGNHDRVHPHMHKNKPGKSAEWQALYQEAGIGTIALQHTVEIDGNTVDVCHFPYPAEQGANSHDMGPTDRYAPWRPRDIGQWLICGHVHQAWRQRGRAINVGVDAWGGKPVSSAQVSSLIAQGPAHLPPIAWVRGPATAA